MSRELIPEWIPIQIHGLQWELTHSMFTNTKIQVRRDQNSGGAGTVGSPCTKIRRRNESEWKAQGKGGWRETHPIFNETLQNLQMLEDRNSRFQELLMLGGRRTWELPGVPALAC